MKNSFLPAAKTIAALILAAGALNRAWAAPVIGVPNLIYTVGESSQLSYSSATPGDVQVSATSISSEVAKELPMYNADVRGELIKTGHYKVVDMRNQFALNKNQLNNALADKLVRQLNRDKSESSGALLANADLESSSATEQAIKPDYILLGVLTNRDSGENIYPLANTNKVSQTYSVDILVEYRLIDYASKQVVASFSVTGHGSDLKIMTNNQDGRAIHYNYGQAIHAASKDLAANVLAELDAQFKISDKLKQDEAPRVITDVKTYSND